MAVEATLEPTFPEDIERTITEALLNDTRDMCGTMSLVASPFDIWTRPFSLHTVVVRRRNNWMGRIRDVALPNARFIRILVLNLPHRVCGGRGQLPDAELLLIRALLKASTDVKHLAVSWNIWAVLDLECGALQLKSLYLIWDGVFYISPPSLHNFQHPDALQNLTMGAPLDLNNQTLYQRFGRRYIPEMRHCVNLAYLTYASDRIPIPGVGSLVHLKGTMMVVVSMLPLAVQWIERDKRRFPVYSAVSMPHWKQVLTERVAKMERRKSLLDHA